MKSPETAYIVGAVLGVLFTLLSFAVVVLPKLIQIDREFKALQAENTRLKNSIQEMGWF